VVETVEAVPVRVEQAKRDASAQLTSSEATVDEQQAEVQYFVVDFDILH
jgi:hypothetical protein